MNKDRKWTSGPNDPGILRKKDDGTETELLVFGYACKLFRDDQRASEIDRGTHLINWMGQESLKIDRYDARGHLNDLIAYETSESYVLTPEEKRIEQLCDEERYRALYSNEEENQLYQEEEYKRLRQALNQDNEYGQVAYSYNEKCSEDIQPEPEPVEQQEEQFIPDPMLEIPFGMDVPDTIKQHMIIEKTAFMVDSHGSQMEFLLKVKQGSNAKFSFLHSTDRLNPYYNYIRNQIKARKYKPQMSSSSDQPQTSYLHPSLIATPHVEAAPIITTIPSIAYKPSADCAYNQLVNKIRTVQKSQELIEPAPTTKETVAPPPKVVKIIDSLFKYCNRNGLNINEFANRLPQSDENTKFRFPDNPYHSYWITRLMEAQDSSLKYEDASHDEKSKVQDSSIPSNEIDQSEDMDSSSNTGFSLNPTHLYEDDSSCSSEASEQQPMEISSSDITKADEKTPIHINGNLPTTVDNNSCTLAQPNILNSSTANMPTFSEPAPITSTAHLSTASNNSLQPKPPKLAPVSFSIKNKKDEKLEISSALPLESSDSEGADEAEVETKLVGSIEKDSSSSKSEIAPLTSTIVKSATKESEKQPSTKKKVRDKDSGDQPTTKRKIKSSVKNSPSEERKKRHKKNDSSKFRESNNLPFNPRKEPKKYNLDSKSQDYSQKNYSSNSSKVQQINKLEPKSLDFSPPEPLTLPKELVSPSREKSLDQLMKMEQRRKRLKEFKMKMAAQGMEDLKTHGCDKVKRIPLKPTGDNDTTYGPHLELIDGQITSPDESNAYGVQQFECSPPPVVPNPLSEKLETVDDETSLNIQMSAVTESNGVNLPSFEDLPGPSRTLTSNLVRRTVDMFRDETGGNSHQKLKKHKKKKRKSEKKAMMKKSKKKKKKYGHSSEQKYDPTLSESSSSAEIVEDDDSSSTSSLSTEEEQNRREKRRHKGKKRKSSKRSHKKQSHRHHQV